MIKRLIIAPHIDDELLGCFSAIDKNTFILYCGCDESHINFDWVRQRPDSNTRLDELQPYKINTDLIMQYYLTK